MTDMIPDIRVLSVISHLALEGSEAKQVVRRRDGPFFTVAAMSWLIELGSSQSSSTWDGSTSILLRNKGEDEIDVGDGLNVWTKPRDRQ